MVILQTTVCGHGQNLTAVPWRELVGPCPTYGAHGAPLSISASLETVRESGYREIVRRASGVPWIEEENAPMHL